MEKMKKKKDQNSAAWNLGNGNVVYVKMKIMRERKKGNKTEPKYELVRKFKLIQDIL